VIARQPWYIGHNSPNRPSLRIAQKYQRNYTSLKSTFSALHFPRWQCGSIFIRLAVVASRKCEVAQNSEKIWPYSSSWSSKVINLGANRKCIAYAAHFLLVSHSDFGHILHRFWDTATYWSKIAYFSYHSLIRGPSCLCSLWNFAVKLTTRKLESWGYLWWKLQDPNFNLFWLIHPCDRQTDRQTDGRTGGR